MLLCTQHTLRLLRMLKIPCPHSIVMESHRYYIIVEEQSKRWSQSRKKRLWLVSVYIDIYIIRVCSNTKCLLPWCNCRGWLGITSPSSTPDSVWDWECHSWVQTGWVLALTGANEDCHSLVEMGNWGPALNLVSCCIRGLGVCGGVHSWIGCFSCFGLCIYMYFLCCYVS